MTIGDHTDLLHTLDLHQTGRLFPAPSSRLLRSHKAFIFRLRPVAVPIDDRIQHHHSGCVNRICWSPNGGHFLGSVSDDRTIRVWLLNNDHSLKRQRTFSTLHQGNIFGIRFLSCDPGQLVFATGSREGTVCVTFAESLSESISFKCHRESVMEIEQSLDRPAHVFWSASDDCTIRQWDLRCPIRCRCYHGEECTSDTILIDGRSVDDAWRFSSICASPVDSNIILTGSGTAGRLFDRRMLSVHPKRNFARTHPVQEFMPSWLSDSSHDPFVTHTNFSPDGRRVVINYNGDHAYVFNSKNYEDEFSRIPLVNPKRRSSQSADQYLELATEQTRLRQWDNAVRYCSIALSLPNVSNDVKRSLLVQRSKALLNRRWLGDTSAALRDAQSAMLLLKGCKDASTTSQLNECLDELGQIDRVAELQDGALSNINAPNGHVDYSTRLVGHANIETGIKESTFLSNDVVGCASDDGIVYIYDAENGVILHTLTDGSPETLGLNTVRSHPNLGVSCIATSGLDHHIQLFTATGPSSRCTYSDDHRYLVHFNQQSLLNNHTNLSIRHLFFFRTVALEDFDE